MDLLVFLFHLFLVFLLILLGLSEPHYMGEFRGINIINEIIMTSWFSDMSSTLRFSLATILFVLSFVYLSSYTIVQPNEAIGLIFWEIFIHLENRRLSVFHQSFLLYD